MTLIALDCNDADVPSADGNDAVRPEIERQIRHRSLMRVCRPFDHRRERVLRNLTARASLTCRSSRRLSLPENTIADQLLGSCFLEDHICKTEKSVSQN